MSLERDLKQAFERHAGDVRPSTDPLGEATSRLQRARRRRAAGYVLGVAAVAAALGIALPKLIGNRSTQIIKPGPKPTTSGYVTISGPIQDIQLVTPREGWIVQQGTMYVTSDGGGSWQTVVTPNPPVTGVAAAFALPTSAWTVWPDTTGDPLGAARLIINRSPLPTPCAGDQGGCDTEEIRTAAVNSVGFGPISIFFIDPNRGWLLVDLGGGSGAAHGSQLFATTDRGKHWHELPRPPSLAPTGVQSIVFADAAHGLMTDGAQLYRTLDGGGSWTLVEPTKGFNVHYACHPPTRSFGRPRFLDTTTALIPSGAQCPNGSVEPEIYETRDAGITWTLNTGLLAVGTDEMVLSTPTENTWYAWVGTKHIYETNDAGTHWQQLNSNLPQHVLQLGFADGQDGWASVSREGCSGDVRDCTDVYQTSDAGRSWQQLIIRVLRPMPHCRASELSASVVQQSISSQVQFRISVHNQTLTGCNVGEIPDRVQLTDAAGRPLNVQYEPPSGRTSGNYFLLLAPNGESQVITLLWSNWCGAAPGSIVFRVALATAAENLGVLSLPYQSPLLPRCDHSRSPSTITAELFAVPPPIGRPPLTSLSPASR